MIPYKIERLTVIVSACIFDFKIFIGNKLRRFRILNNIWAIRDGTVPKMDFPGILDLILAKLKRCEIHTLFFALFLTCAYTYFGRQ